MAVDFREVEIKFDPTADQEQHEHQLVPFDRQVRRASAALKAIDNGFIGDDHPILRQKVDIDVYPKGQYVDVWVHYLLTDNTGFAEDPYEGRFEVMVIAEVAD